MDKNIPKSRACFSLIQLNPRVLSKNSRNRINSRKKSCNGFAYEIWDYKDWKEKTEKPIEIPKFAFVQLFTH